MKEKIEFIVAGIVIGLFLGYAWHFFAVKDKLEVYRNYEQILKEKDAEIVNLKFRSELCCGYVNFLTDIKKKRK